MLDTDPPTDVFELAQLMGTSIDMIDKTYGRRVARHSVRLLSPTSRAQAQAPAAVLAEPVDRSESEPALGIRGPPPL